MSRSPARAFDTFDGETVLFLLVLAGGWLWHLWPDLVQHTDPEEHLEQ